MVGAVLSEDDADRGWVRVTMPDVRVIAVLDGSFVLSIDVLLLFLQLRREITLRGLIRCIDIQEEGIRPRSELFLVNYTGACDVPWS